MSREDALVRFEDVSFGYGHNKPILTEVSFSIRDKMKIAIMGQNGAGKSTIFQLITGELQPIEGEINILPKTTIATARQVIPRTELDLTVRAFFEARFPKKVYDIDPKIDAVLAVVHLDAPKDRIVRSFSGGQQARLLLASALIQDPDLLLLDEPTNNLDAAGIAHLTDFLVNYQKACVVISHDAAFLNAFTKGVLYLDVRTRVVEQYAGNYNDVLKDITARIERENRKNAQLAKEIQENKDKANFFANKGGQMRMVAKRMRTKAEEMEAAKVDVRKEDRTIRPFAIPIPENMTGDLITISSVTILRDGTPKEVETDIVVRKGKHLLLKGPNGIGKSTLLEALATGKAPGASLMPGVTVGYYRQDFSTLDFDDTVHDSLMSVMERKIEQDMRAVAAGFLIGADAMQTRVGDLSEGQKGLVAFARLVLEKPPILILDEPTNHINFRHLPEIAKALDQYQGAMILVSHVPEFVSQIRIDETLDLEKIAEKKKKKK